jgi:holo-ACP synthase/triphosphoribosyl-dephospho-CoA synthase
MNKILAARELRSKHIEKLQADYPRKSVLILKNNIVGSNKNPTDLRFVCAFFDDIIKTTFSDKILLYGKKNSLDGNYCYYVIDEKGLIVKEKTIDIEEYYLLGRLVDLDVYDQKSISRNELSCEMRKCLLCDNYAHICVRQKTHSETELFSKIHEMTSTFLQNHLTMLTMRAIYGELELYPKFGLVSHIDSGSHTDMDYETFVKSTFAIKPFIKAYIKAGLEMDINPSNLQQIGVEAEKAMFEATNGINTHKGLIFLLGLLLPAVTKGILYHQSEKEVMNTIKDISASIVGDYYDVLDNKQALSHGDEIYINHNIKGARGLGLNGMEIVFDAPVDYDANVRENYQDYLLYFMSKLNDTTIIYRHGIEGLNMVKKDATTILQMGGYQKNLTKYNQLSDQYKEKGISPGGSADLLVCKILLDDVRYLLKK